MHEVLVNRLGGLSLPRKSVVRLTDRPCMTLDVYRGHKTTMQQQQIRSFFFLGGGGVGGGRGLRIRVENVLWSLCSEPIQKKKEEKKIQTKWKTV